MIFVYRKKVRQETVRQIFLQVSTGSTDNLKPELVLKAYHEQTGLSWNPGDISICRLETYTNTAVSTPDCIVAPQFVPLREMGNVIMSRRRSFYAGGPVC